jgi:prophage regulatory protein
MVQAILRLPTVKAHAGLSRSAIYLLMSKGQFPRPIAIGKRAVGWIESEVQDWIREQIKKSRKPKTIPRRHSRQEARHA